MSARLPRIAMAGLLVLILAVPALARRTGRYILNPKSYVSASGQYSLYVNPSTIYGQGEGEYRLTRAGSEVWAGKLPFTLWDCELTDDGTVAGYAYSLGMENCPKVRSSEEDGALHLVIIDPSGKIRMNETLPRRGMFSCMSTVDRSVTGILVDPENDRFLVRCHEDGWAAKGETWRTYQLSSGTRMREFQFDHARTSDRENWFLLAAKPVAGTPLIVVNWKYSKWDQSGNQLRSTGGCFALVDPAGKIVWELDRPADYPDYYEFSTRVDRQKDGAEFERLFQLEREITDNGAILRTDQSGCFDLWFVKDNQRVTMGVEQAAAGQWRVRERERAARVPAGPPKQPDKLQSLAPRHLGSIELQIQQPKAPEIRDLKYFDLDDRGRIGLVRREKDGSHAFLVAEPDGKIVRTVDLKELLGPKHHSPKGTWLNDDRWLIAAETWQPVASDQISPSKTVACFLDSSTGKLIPIESFSGQGARHYAATNDGGFVATIEPPDLQSSASVLVAFDQNGQERWRNYPTERPGYVGDIGYVVTTSDHRLMVDLGYGRTLSFLSMSGTFVRSVECKEMLGEEFSHAHFVTADVDGGLIIGTETAPGRVARVRKDGSVRSRFDVKHPDGRSVELMGFPDEIGLRVTKDGVLWACDGESMLRLNDQGVVQQVLGEAPDRSELRKIAGIAIDQSGNSYVADARNGVTHVFDASGGLVRVLRPNPTDFKDPSNVFVDVAENGSTWLDGLKFSAGGDRIGFRQLPSGAEDASPPFGIVRCQPRSDQYWIVSYEEIKLVDGRNETLRSIKRRPDGCWLDWIRESAVAPDGSIAVGADSTAPGGMIRRSPSVISTYSPSGQPRNTSQVPVDDDRLLFLEPLAFDGRYVLTGRFGYEIPRCLLLDSETGTWYDLGSLVLDEDQWHFFFVKDGREIWMFAEKARKIERFENPLRAASSGSSSP